MNSIDIIIIMNYTDKRNSLFFASLFACLFICLLLLLIQSLTSLFFVGIVFTVCFLSLLHALLLIVWLGAFFRVSILSVLSYLCGSSRIARSSNTFYHTLSSFISRPKKNFHPVASAARGAHSVLVLYNVYTCVIVLSTDCNNLR